MTDSDGQSPVQQKLITMDDVNRVLDVGRILISVLTEDEKKALSKILSEETYKPGQRIRLNQKNE